MRVTVVCSMYPPALAPEAPHAALLCKHLAAAGAQVTLITTHMDAPRPRGEGFGVRDVMPHWGWRAAPRLFRELNRSNPDVVLLIFLGWIYDRHPMVTFLPTLCRGLKKRPRVIVQFENTGGAEQTTGSRWLCRKLAALLARGRGIEYRYGTLLRDSDHVIALCEPHLRFLSKFTHGLNDRSTIIPAPPLLRIVADPRGDVRRRTRARLGYAPNDFVVAYFGYVYPEKGVETVIEAAGKALPKVPNLRLLMIGGSPANIAERNPTYPARLRARVRELGLAEQTFWVGHCEPDAEDASNYLHAADACVLPFAHGIRLNNSSYAVVTSHGLPVVTTRAEDLEAEFRDRENVMLFHPGDADTAADCLVQLATEPALRNALRTGALAFSRGRSSWDAVTRQTLEVLRPSPEIQLIPAAQRLPRPAVSPMPPIWNAPRRAKVAATSSSPLV
ncbi:MAG TPA: glycosyltransferase family 4 protein [Tepidisphaeraceae bacterium]|nr:glycosyltransferase family 4 protein [Tepidisphaeraceae bacterium]